MTFAQRVRLVLYLDEVGADRAESERRLFAVALMLLSSIMRSAFCRPAVRGLGNNRSRILRFAR